MQSVYIPQERIKKLKDNKAYLKLIEKLTKCKLKVEDEFIEVEGEAFGEFVAKNIIYAFGRGFDMEIAEKLAEDNYYFTSIALEQLISSEKRIKQLKARIIGVDGRTKRYIEEVSAAKLSIYGDTVSFIGTIEEINEAETAVNTLIDGGTHRLAYNRMEAAHRKHKTDAKKASF